MKPICPPFARSRLRAACWVAVLTGVAIAVPTATAALAQQAYLKASNPDPDDRFGTSMAISGDTLLIGAPNEDSNATGVDGDQSDNSRAYAGAAYVFVRNGATWTQQAYLKPSNPGVNSLFGRSVAISRDTIVIGAYGESSNATGVNGDASNTGAPGSGAAYVFVRNGTDWSQQAYLKASNTGASDNFGYSVAVSGDTVVIGAVGEASNAKGVNGNQSDNSAFYSGAAYVFVRSGTNWSQQAFLKASNTEINDNFGCSVALSGETTVVGAFWEDSKAAGVNGNQNDNSGGASGACYIFVRVGTSWSQQAYLKASNPGDHDQFGHSVAILGDTVVVGAPLESSNAIGVNGDGSDDSANASGAAYVFVRSGATWHQEAYLKASNTGGVGLFIGDYFGISVALSADMVVIGAPREESSATGVNGNQSDNSASGAGAGYVFTRSGTNWIQQAYLKASNTEQSDAFGISVAASDGTVIVGAFLEDSNAIGTNGNQSDNSASDSGACYVFPGFCPICPRLAITPDGSGGYFIRFIGTPGATYRLESSRYVYGGWDTLDWVTAPAPGYVEYHDMSPPASQAFYRTVQP